MIAFPDVTQREWNTIFYGGISLMLLGVTQLFDIAWWIIKHVDVTFKITGVN